MLFDKKIEPCCSYCDSGVKISPTEVACLKKGIVSAAGSCKHFKYDPLKREPPIPASLDADSFSREDFEL